MRYDLSTKINKIHKISLILCGIFADLSAMTKFSAESEASDASHAKIGVTLLNGLFGCLGSLPLKVLYGISDFVSFMAGRVVGYRRKVIRQNLESAFPEKNIDELRRIEKNFYRFLADYFVETLRLGRMSEKEARRRMRFNGMDQIRKSLEDGRNVSLYLGHYCNWEWLSTIPIHLRDSGAATGQIYHPLENEASDRAFLKIRGHFGATSIRMADTLPTLLKWKKDGRPSITGYIADQVPLLNGVHLFVDFLNHDTPVFTGPERLSRMLHSEVYYCDIVRPKRGEYECTFRKIADDASGLPQFELTQRYFALLEESIRSKPEYWLWSHRRWKRTRENFYSYFGEEVADKMLSRL